MSQTRVMVIGAVGSGKTTLINALNQEEGEAVKTQSVNYLARAMDTPGEYMENPFFYKALFATSLEAGVLLFVQDATARKSVYPPGFAGAFSRRSIGAVTKIDHPEADIDRAGRFLRSLGLCGPVFAVSAFSGDGMEELRKVLNWS